MLLPLDELGAFGGREIAKAVYDLSGGIGKSRMAQDATMRESRSWRVLVLSTGEISIEQKIAEDSGREAKAGQLVRMLDIPIPESIMPNSHGMDSSVFANQLKSNAGRFYGTAGSEFVARLIHRCADETDLRITLRQEMDRWSEEVLLGGMGELERRALRRFSLVVAAGMLGARLGVLPMEPSAVDAAGSYVWSLWNQESANVSDGARAIRSIREFILRHRESKFRAVDLLPGEGPMVRDLAGYFCRRRDLYLFTAGGFSEAVRGCDHKATLRELHKAGLFCSRTIRGQRANIRLQGLKGESACTLCARQFWRRLSDPRGSTHRAIGSRWEEATSFPISPTIVRSAIACSVAWDVADTGEEVSRYQSGGAVPMPEVSESTRDAPESVRAPVGYVKRVRAGLVRKTRTWRLSARERSLSPCPDVPMSQCPRTNAVRVAAWEIVSLEKHRVCHRRSG